MGSIWLREFTGGLDTRRRPETTQGGALIEATDGHVNRGGEFEQRAAFVLSHTLPTGTTGLAYDKTGLVVFGDAEAPSAMPPGVRYQRLQHVDDLKLEQVLSADLYAGKLYVVGEFSDGSRVHFYDGVRVDDWYDGRARVSFTLTRVIEPAAIEFITINGVRIIPPGPIALSADFSTSAARIAAAINDFVWEPNYTAASRGATVIIVAEMAGTTANGYGLSVSGDSDNVQITTDSAAMTGGADPSTVFVPGSFVKTVGSKIYSLSDSNLHFSGIQRPTEWQTDATGAGFIDLSTESSGAEDLVALAKYQGFIAIFAERTIQVWYVDPDPALNKQVQVLNNTGTGCARSVTQFGDNDLFYLAESGLRSLRARDSSNAAATTDIGVPIDDLVTDALSELGENGMKRVIGLIEPRDSRFWLVIGDRIFVFSYFPGSSVSAWSMYRPGFVVDDAVVFRQRVYVRSGDRILAYGGTGSKREYDDTPARARLPFLDGDAPARQKRLTGVDASLDGVWRLSVSTDPNAPDAMDVVGILNQTTFGLGQVPVIGGGTHVSLLLESEGPGPHRLASLVIHYDSDEEAT